MAQGKSNMPPVEEKASPRHFPSNAIHLVRTVEQMQLQLSQMADQKASMLMGASSLVFTVAVGQMRSGGAMMLPILLLAVTAFLSALFAIFVVMPTVTRARPEGIVSSDNLLFFGIFTAMPEQAFVDRVLDYMETDESTYRAMLRDTYQAGAVLRTRKYRYLGYAYRIFLTGMVVTALTAVAELATGSYF
jgi:hypothetical protein